MRELFNDEQKKYIIENYEMMKYSDIAKKLGNQYNATQIAGWLHNNNYKKSNRSIFTNDDKNYILLNYKYETYSNIANHLNFTERQIRHYVEHYLEKKLRSFNSRYFQYIDTPTKAYWIGYIYADGYIVNNPLMRTYEFGMRLQKRDVQVLIDLNKELGNVHKITEHHFEKIIYKNKNKSISDIVSLRVYSKELVNDLISHNIVCNKTYKPNYPKIENYFFDFLRGYIDGDGCIYVNKNKYLLIHITSFKVDVLEYISNRLKNEYNIKSKVYEENPRKHRLILYGKSAYKLLQLIYYDDSVQKLDRKYKKYLLYKNQGSL